MENQGDDLETHCEDAVYQICCTRESYSARCAKQLEKYLGLVTKKQTAKVQTHPVPNFDKPLITERQEKLFDDFVTQKNDHSAKKHGSREALSRVKELKSILNQIESSIVCIDVEKATVMEDLNNFQHLEIMNAA